MTTCNYPSMNNYIINSALLPPHGLIYRTIPSTTKYCSLSQILTELDLTNNCYDNIDINSYWCNLIFGYIIDIAEVRILIYYIMLYKYYIIILL